MRSKSQIKSDINYEKKRAAERKGVFARFDSEEMNVIQEAIAISGSAKSMIFNGAKLIIKKKG